ncbi:MAG TPA: amidohydrolase family protein [Bryobacteraceae bacterium]|nr:amidohydrolase family protein [Bryobacteraceae bacterium]
MKRDSPWGPLAVADAHLHFFSHRFFTALAAQQPGLTPEEIAAKIGLNLPPQEPEKLASMWTQELDRHHVERATLIASVPGDEASVLAAVHAHPFRFFAYAMVNPRMWRPENLSEVSAVCLFPAMHCYPVHDDCVRPVFEWAEQNRRVVFVHCGVLSLGIRGRLGLASPFDMRFSNPIDLHAIALRYPAVPMVVPHFGAGYFREALMLADLCPNVYLDTSSSNSWMKYQESHLDLRQVFRRTLDVVGPRRLLFGTDSALFPPGWKQQVFEDQATALYELGVSLHDARAIFGENLLRILAR